MSYESTAEPIKIGYLMDFTLAAGVPRGDVGRLHSDFRHRIRRGGAAGTDGSAGADDLSRGRGPAQGLGQSGDRRLSANWSTRDASWCSARNITDNCVPMREAIEERFKVPAISVTGTDDWLGEWTFAFPQGSMTDEPIFMADLIAKRGLTEIGVLVEQSLIGESYLKNLRSACRRKGIRIVAEAAIAQTAQDINEAVSTLHEAKVRGDRAPGIRIRHRLHQPRAGGHRLGPAALHHHRMAERVGQPDHVERVHGMDRCRPVRRGEQSRPGLPRPLREEVQRQSSRILRDRGQSRRRRDTWCGRSPMPTRSARAASKMRWSG